MTAIQGPAVAYVTSEDAPDQEVGAALAAFAAAGLAAERVVWDDPAAEWSRYDVAVVRSAWDYTGRRAEFLAWARRTAELTRLCNPAAVLERTRASVVVGFGGLLGIGRRLAAVPVEHVTISADPATIGVTRDVLQDAPAFVDGAPFSRREEQVVCAYFGCTPYWG